MKFRRTTIWMSCLLPVLALACFTLLKHQQIGAGKEVILPIEGYDPRDLLSGHYLIYQVQYGIKGLCDKKGSYSNIVCLEPKFSQVGKVPNKHCQVFIRGNCRNHQFNAGIERFFVNEKKAKLLEQLIREKKAEVKVRVSSDGKAHVTHLQLDGKPFELFVNKNK